MRHDTRAEDASWNNRNNPGSLRCARKKKTQKSAQKSALCGPSRRGTPCSWLCRGAHRFLEPRTKAMASTSDIGDSLAAEGYSNMQVSASHAAAENRGRAQSLTTDVFLFSRSRPTFSCDADCQLSLDESPQDRRGSKVLDCSQQGPG